MNSLVNYRLAKSLKEKGFDEPCRYVHDTWNNIKDWLEDGEGEHRNSHKNKSVYYSAPTIAEVIMWLYEKHGIWIYTYPVQTVVLEDDNYPKTVWIAKCLSMRQVMFEKFIDADNGLSVNHHRGPAEALEAAIEFILKDYIK